MIGEDCFYDRIFELREYAEELLSDDGSNFRLKPSHFVFYCHQGYIFRFFDTAEGDDPQIYFYFERDMIPKVEYSNFREFLKAKICEQAGSEN